MNTLKKEQLDRLERAYSETQAPQTSAADSVSQSDPLLQVRLLALAMVGFALFTVCNPNGYNLMISASLVVALLVLHHVASRENRPVQTKSASGLWSSKAVKLLSALAIFGVGYAAATATTAQPAKLDGLITPPMLSGATDAFQPIFQQPEDPNRGTTEIGPVLPGLSLQKSMITGHVDARSLTSTMYWNIVFDNTSDSTKEARAKIALPEGGTVTRATLWVNGVPQEAAFDAISKVQQAYQWIVQRNRDPLLITQQKDGEIIAQAFPVPAHGKMRLRIGFTAPLHANSRNDFELTTPHIVSSNFAYDKLLSTVKLESNATINSTLVGQTVTEEQGSSILNAHMRSSDQKDTKFFVHTEKPFDTFVTRATHSLEKSFIVERLQDEGFGQLKLVTEKTTAIPTVQVAYDFPTASRVSSIWALQESNKLIENNDFDSAGQLGHAYRIVTRATGATVLERQSDYEHSGLDRNQYSVVSASVHSGSQSEQAWSGQAPVLQGATNGTIGPQGGDATSIMGVNTAGTVRVNNLANLEWLMNVLSTGFAVLAFAFGAIFLGKSFSGTSLAKTRNVVAGASCLILAITASTTMSWLIQSARDANLFS